ncbi:asparagine synthase-related protein [Kitasatospora sp. NPDC050543]|uniref:asparagine synthase-related protein n=1 Tax=Kitasatospora sp. NPDC050543 TaxID=3364054 RepID=UPI003791BDE7
MRWLTGWSGGALGAGTPAREAPSAVRPIAARPLWGGVNPLWAVGDWRPDEIRLVTLRPGAPAVVSTGPTAPDPVEDTPATTRLAVLGHCGASDVELAAGLAAARGGAVRHLSGWPGSYTVVLRTGLRSTLLLTDLAGSLPVFHTPWYDGTAYATAALPLADLVGAPLDTGHLAARLACPESPEALGTGTPYLGVQRVPPGHVLGIRGGRPYVAAYDENDEHGAGQRPRGEAPAVRELTRALLEAVRSRVRTPGHPAGVPAPAPAARPRLGVDLSYGTASATVALLAAAVPIGPGPAGPRTGALVPHPGHRVRTGATKGSWARGPAGEPNEPEQLAAITLAEVELGADAGGAGACADAEAGGGADAWSAAPHESASDDTREGDGAGPAGAPPTPEALVPGTPRLRHTVLPATERTLPFAALAADAPSGPLTDEPGPELISAARAEARFEAGGADHLTGYGARQVLDGHPARLADLIRAGRPRELLPPVAALAATDRAVAGVLVGALRTPVTVLRAAHRLSRIRYADALDDAAVKLTLRHGRTGAGGGAGTAGAHSAADLAWCVPGPAARWLSDDALSAVALRLRLAARGPVPREHPGARRARHALHRQAAAYRTLVQATEQPGQRLHAPFLDNRVVRAARLLPDEVRLQPGARHALLHAVLTGAGRTDLPADWGRGPRPDRVAPARAGLRRAADGIAELFDDPLLAEAGLIDLAAVRQSLRQAADPGAELPPAELAGLAELVSTELWLRRVRARRHGSCWTGLPLAERTALAAARFA